MTGYHAAAALTPMRFDVFTAAVALGSLLRAWTYAFFGNAILERSTGRAGRDRRRRSPRRSAAAASAPARARLGAVAGEGVEVAAK